MPSDTPTQTQKPVIVTAVHLNHLSDEENWRFVLIRVACSHAKLFETCIIRRCRRQKRCDVSHEEWIKGKFFPLCPPCIRTDPDRQNVRKRLEFIVDQGKENSPIYGKHLLSHKLPPRHRGCQ